jgi:hypothetical protein
MTKRRPQGLYGQALIEWVYENRTIEDEESGCILWTGPMGTNNSPMITYGGPGYEDKAEGKKTWNFKVNRLFWEFRNGMKIPEGLYAGHTCEATSPDHNRCINYKHIILQSPAENMNAKVIAHKETGSTAYIGAQTRFKDRIPSNLPHSEKVSWILANRTEKVEWIDKKKNKWNCINYLGHARKGGNTKMSITFNSKDSGQTIDTKGQRTVSTSRYIYFILNEIDYLNTDGTKVVVRHKCGNGVCIKPEHLHTGSQRDNILDMRATSKNTKLTKEIVKEIMEDWLEKWNNNLISTQTGYNIEWQKKLNDHPYNLNVSHHIINNMIWRGHTPTGTWKDITKPYFEKAKNWNRSIDLRKKS